MKQSCEVHEIVTPRDKCLNAGGVHVEGLRDYTTLLLVIITLVCVFVCLCVCLIFEHTYHVGLPVLQLSELSLVKFCNLQCYI